MNPLTRNEIVRQLLEWGWWIIAIRALMHYGYRCEYCLADLTACEMDGWPLDHLRPKRVVHKGPKKWTHRCRCGCNAVWNLVICCRSCNRAKGVYDPADDCGDNPTRADLIEAARNFTLETRAQREQTNRFKGAIVKLLSDMSAIPSA